jgi:hypothetical protein
MKEYVIQAGVHLTLKKRFIHNVIIKNIAVPSLLDKLLIAIDNSPVKSHYFIPGNIALQRLF